MKSSERCASNFQGDRCKARSGHLTQPDDTTPEELRPFHFSNFSVWDVDGALVGKALGAEIKPNHRRNRHVSRAFRQLIAQVPYSHMHGQRAVDVISDLGKLEKFYRGGQ